MKKIYLLNHAFKSIQSSVLSFSLLAVCCLLAVYSRAQTPNLPTKATLSQTLLSGRTFTNATAVDTVAKQYSGSGNYTLEVTAKVNSATGRGLDIESRNAALNGFRLSLDAANLKNTSSLAGATTLTASKSGENQVIRVAVMNDSAHIYQNGAYIQSQPLSSIADIAAGVETDNLYNTTVGPALIPDWAGTAPANTGKPSDYGWLLNPTSATLFANANSTTAGTSRYMDVNASSGTNLHTYNSATYVGRLLYVRWDGSYANTLYAYPVTLEANTIYDFSLLYAYISNGTPGSSITVGIGTTTAASGRIATKTFATSSTIRALKKGDFVFTAPTAGTYYITINGPTALYSIGELSVNKLTALPRFIFGKNYPAGAVNMEIASVTYEDGAYAPAGITTGTVQDVTVTGSTAFYPVTFNTNFIVPGKTDLHLTGDNSPLVNSTVALQSNNAWLFFDNVRPGKVISDWLSKITINGAAAVNNTNVRIAVYKNGTAVIPNGNLTSNAALEVFTQPNGTGNSQTYAIQNINNSLGAFNNSIRSFKLKRGYMATFANNPNGSGYSRVFIANDSDLVVNAMPAGLDTTVSFIRVMKWNWPSKKGKAGWDPERIGATWYYDWNIAGNNAAANYEYQGIRQAQYWPSFTDIINKGVNHISGYNEPDQTNQANLTVEQAFSTWPEMMQTGLRIGSPSPASPESSWITQFLAKCDSFNYRVDYVTIHCYWGGQTPAQWYSRLKAIYDRVKRPLWITEWNNGANWTTETWPTDWASQQQKQLNDLKGILQVLDTASFVERYAEYDWVENKRALVLADTLTPAGKYYYADKSDFAYNPAKAFVHNWKLVSPRIYSTIQDTNYFKAVISWNDLNGELGSKYTLERKIDGRDADFMPVQDFTGYAANAAMAFTDSVYGKATYRLKAYGLDGIAFVYSGSLDVIRDAAPLAATSLTGTVISSSIVQLTWNTAPTARSYNLKRSLSATGPWTTIAAHTTALSYADSTLTPNTTYYFVVTTLNSAGESANSTVLTLTTPALVIPATVVNPHVASGDAKVTLTWDFQYDAKYKILRSIDAGGPWDTIVTNLSSLRYEDMGRTNGAIYYYKMMAYNQVGNSPLTSLLIARPAYGQHLHIYFNEAAGNKARDEWGAYNGTLFNAATWTAGKDSATGAVKLNKDSSSYIQLENGVVSTINDFTVATWFKMPANQGANTRVFDFGTSTTNFMMLSPRYAANGVNGLRYKLTCAAGTFQPTIPYELPLNTWVYVVISQKDSVFKLYVNGQLQYTDSTVHVKPSDMGVTNQNYIGRSVWSTDPYSDQTYDDFRIYNYALSDQGVYALFVGSPILPVKLVAFTGKPTPQGNLLNWKITTNSDAIQMELERSADAGRFTKIYSVSAGSSNNVLTFNYTDAQASGVVTYYRLKMTEVDGKVSYSPVVALSNKVKGIEVIGMYPTLVSSNAYLSISAANSTSIKTVITDIYGRMVQQTGHELSAGGNLIPVDAVHLATGTYLLTVYDTETKAAKVIRFVVSH